MKVSRFLIVLVCLFGVAAVADDEKDKEKERTEIRQMSHKTLTRLYKVESPAKAAIKKAYGYAVFSNTGIKILFGGSGKGEGVAIRNQDKSEIFMKMFEIQAGLGMGVKKFQVIFVFDNQKAFDAL
jgi:lipid-binding SYLF domain-containing protein